MTTKFGIIGLSTAWNAYRCASGQELINEIKSLGFDRVELNFTLTGRVVNEIAALVNNHQIIVTSVHNFCPLPDHLTILESSPDHYSLAALDEMERKKAVHFTKQTIDTAALLKAKAVVLHTGKVLTPDHTRTLTAYYEKGEKDSPRYCRLKEEMVIQRREKSRPHLDQLIKSLEELLPWAKKYGLKLCFENRFYYNEIPHPEEGAQLLQHFKTEDLYYWHDTGHAQVFENLGLYQHNDYLERLGHRLAGFHLHDVKGTVDHIAPLMGNLDFSRLLPYLKAEHIKVIEVHRPVSAEQIKVGAEHLTQILQ